MTMQVCLAYGCAMSESWQNTYVRHVMATLSLSATALAERAKVSSTTLTRPLNNPEHLSEISIPTLQKIQDATDIPFSPFAPGGQQSQSQSWQDQLPVPDTAEAPPLVNIYDVRASAGHGALIDGEEIVDRVAFPPLYLERLTRTNPRHLAIISVKGESMEPALKDDDIVLIDTTKTSLDYDGLFVLRFGDALHVKRIGRGHNGHVLITSDNPAYRDVELPREEVEVVGKVIWKGQKV